MGPHHEIVAWEDGDLNRWGRETRELSLSLPLIFPVSLNSNFRGRSQQITSAALVSSRGSLDNFSPITWIRTGHLQKKRAIAPEIVQISRAKKRPTNRINRLPVNQVINNLRITGRFSPKTPILDGKWSLSAPKYPIFAPKPPSMTSFRRIHPSSRRRKFPLRGCMLVDLVVAVVDGQRRPAA